MKSRFLSDKKYFSLFLYALTIHSFIVGMCLILIPSQQIQLFGFNPQQEYFFRAQGGVFHIIMSLLYITAAKNPLKFTELVKIIIAVKLLAMVFLTGYFFFINNIITVLLSGIADGAMGIGVLVFFIMQTGNRKIFSYRSALLKHSQNSQPC
ncbi:MAG: hypothetical protein ABR968_08680 [Bacteroidales bacterium]